MGGVPTGGMYAAWKLDPAVHGVAWRDVGAGAGKKAAEFTYYSEFPVRAQGTSLYWFDTPALQSTKCETRFFKSGVPKAQCRKHADVLWQCVQQEAAPRLDATPNPFSHPGAFDETTSTDECQLLLMEQRRLDLGNLSITPTGHVWGRGYFTAVE